MLELPIEIPQPLLDEFCRRNHIWKLALFGSVLTERFRPDSDVDVLVDFDPDHIPGFLGLARMERELGAILGRRVDIRTAGDLSQRFRMQILSAAAVQYERV